mgnify:CR=1 FL=1
MEKIPSWNKGISHSEETKKLCGLAAKRKAPETAGSLQVETPTFALTLITIIVLLTLLQFMPVLVLGPIADQLLLVKG